MVTPLSSWSPPQFQDGAAIGRAATMLDGVRIVEATEALKASADSGGGWVDI